MSESLKIEGFDTIDKADVQALLRDIYYPVPQSLKLLMGNAWGNKKIPLRVDGENVVSLKDSGDAIWHMICIDAIGCYFYLEYCLECAKPAIDEISEVLGDEGVDVFSEWAQERIEHNLSIVPASISEKWKVAKAVGMARQSGDIEVIRATAQILEILPAH